MADLSWHPIETLAVSPLGIGEDASMGVAKDFQSSTASEANAVLKKAAAAKKEADAAAAKEEAQLKKMVAAKKAKELEKAQKKAKLVAALKSGDTSQLTTQEKGEMVALKKQRGDKMSRRKAAETLAKQAAVNKMTPDQKVPSPLQDWTITLHRQCFT
jgi:flagellar biosynthesis GTPase FlhF